MRLCRYPSVIIFNTEVTDYQSEYNNATGVFTSKYAGEVEINGQVRVAALPTTRTASLRIRVAGVQVLETGYTNNSASDQSVYIPFNISPFLQFGDTVDVLFVHDAGGNLDISGGATPKTTFLEITKL